MIIKLGKHLEANQTISNKTNLKWYVNSTLPTINIRYTIPVPVPLIP